MHLLGAFYTFETDAYIFNEHALALYYLKPNSLRVNVSCQ